MEKIILYVKNVVIAIIRLAKAYVFLYRYHPHDSYFYNWWVTVDCLLNAVSGGDPDETISSRSAKAMLAEQAVQRYGPGCRMCSFLAIFQQNHCERALERNKGSRAVIPDDIQ